MGRGSENGPYDDDQDNCEGMNGHQFVDPEMIRTLRSHQHLTLCIFVRGEEKLLKRNFVSINLILFVKLSTDSSNVF